MKLTKKLLREGLRRYDNILETLRGQFAQAAQVVYNEWSQDEDGYDEMVGHGGICQDIADAICEVLNNNDIECSTVSQEIGEQHVYAIAKLDDGVFEVDISPYVYERGGGYNWKKIQGVVFDGSDISITRLSPDPDDFDKMIEY